MVLPMSRQTLLAEAKAFAAMPDPAMRKAIRRAAGRSFADIGAACDPPVCASTVLRWERGDRQPRGEHLVQYVEILDELRKVVA